MATAANLIELLRTGISADGSTGRIARAGDMNCSRSTTCRTCKVARLPCAFKAGLNFSHTSFAAATGASRFGSFARMAQPTNFSSTSVTGFCDSARTNILLLCRTNGRSMDGVTFDLGLRFDRDQIGGRNNFAPRVRFRLPANRFRAHGRARRRWSLLRQDSAQRRGF